MDAVIPLILVHLDQPTLCTCLRVSRTWYDLAGRLLYRHLDLHFEQDRPTARHRWKPSLAVFRDLNVVTPYSPTPLKPLLLRHVRSMDIGEWYHGCYKGCLHPLLLTSLRRLKIWLTYTQCEDLYPSCRVPQLRPDELILFERDMAVHFAAPDLRGMLGHCTRLSVVTNAGWTKVDGKELPDAITPLLTRCTHLRWLFCRETAQLKSPIAAKALVEIFSHLPKLDKGERVVEVYVLDDGRLSGGSVALALAQRAIMGQGSELGALERAIRKGLKGRTDLQVRVKGLKEFVAEDRWDELERPWIEPFLTSSMKAV